MNSLGAVSEGDEVPACFRFVNIASSESQLTEEQLGTFAELLMESNFHPIRNLTEATRSKLGAALQTLSTEEPIPHDHPIRQTQEWQTRRGEIIRHYSELAEAKNLIFAMENNRIIGVAGCAGMGYWKGEDVYEIVHSVVLPEYRGRGISSRLADAVMEHVQGKNENALLVSYTQSPKRIRNWLRRGARQLTAKEHASIYLLPDESQRSLIAEQLESAEEDGWRTFLLPVNPASTSSLPMYG